MQTFIQRYTAGARVEVMPVGGSEDPVATIKQMQKNDPAAREQWQAYCEQHGNGVRDPAKHEPHFMQTFIQRYTAG
eukprot:CAMPEP_0195111742 /NCGR_PEP_ID=MMETSP0448-20130528/96998_1 /TAXON_ID=66468 /ORGANISM="Heterocapsa triquestra, Strain CCMP 448" /LENGTH=75 /DNA_ID=CAMNT_0040148541 /DNA_START=1 /DNA_END=225 /DNA_ORIENTATION=-